VTPSFFPHLNTLVAQAAQHEWLARLAVALTIAVVGVWLARWWARGVDRLLLRFNVEVILRSFLRNVVYAISVIVAVIAALDFAGVPTTSLIAVIGAAGLAIGLALKDSLSNIASGVMLIMLRPFHAGDYVQVAGLEGTIDSVRIFQTHLHTADNRVIILPNSQITAAPIVNFNARGERRVDISIGIGYTDDLAAARQVLLSIANDNRRVKTQPAPDVVVLELGDARVSLQLRAWVPSSENVAARSELLEAIHVAFAEQGIRIPVQGPQIQLVQATVQPTQGPTPVV
jgi:small conductance mechanosensitive channel